VRPAKHLTFFKFLKEGTNLLLYGIMPLAVEKEAVVPNMEEATTWPA
jgi:hypothetical protein